MFWGSPIGVKAEPKLAAIVINITMMIDSRVRLIFANTNNMKGIKVNNTASLVSNIPKKNEAIIITKAITRISFRCLTIFTAIILNNL